jgi:hypothetical protein
VPACTKPWERWIALEQQAKIGADVRGAIAAIGGRIATSTWRSELFVAIHIRERPIAFDTIHLK